MTTHADVLIKEKVLSATKVLVSIPNFISNYKNILSAEAANMMSMPDDEVAQTWIWRRLEKLGIYNDSDSNDILISDDCQEGDARRFFCENGEPNLPIARFKRVWSILKESVNKVENQNSSVSDIKDLVGIMRPIGQLSDLELMDRYHLECADDVVEELSKRAHDRYFVVFKDRVAGLIDKNLTMKFLKVARYKNTPDHIVIGDNFYQLYKSGQFPNAVYEECPLHSGVLLTEGYCDKCQLSWSSVKDKERKFIRVMNDEGDTPTSRFDIRKLVEEATGNDGIISLKKIYPMIGVKYEELVDEGRLPSLKVRSSESSIQDPFNSSKRRF